MMKGETTMRFLMAVHATRESEAGQPPDPRLTAAVGQFTEEMTRAGVVLMTAGLAPSAMGARLSVSGGKLSVVDGPFAEATEVIGGFAIIQAKSLAEAVEHGKRFMKVHQEVLGPTWEGVTDVRPMFGPEDFGAPRT
jgi:hypothetical protein